MDRLYNPLWPAMAIDRPLAQSIVAGNEWPSIDISHNLLWRAMVLDRQTYRVIYCGQQWTSVGISHNLLWPAMAIDERGSPPIVFDNVYRSTISPVYWRQYLSIHTFHNILSQTIDIDRFPPSSIVEAMNHCCVHCPWCGHRQTMQLFLYLGGLVVASADILPEITRRIRFAWACYNRSKRELNDM